MSFLWLPVLCSCLGQSPNTGDLIRMHEKTLSSIKSIHIKLQLSFPATSDRGSETAAVHELWRSGLRERSVSRDFTHGNTKGDVLASAFTDKEFRSLRGWDPENPDPLPLHFATHAKAFARVRGTIVERDPRGGTSALWLMLLFEIRPGLSLTKLAENSELGLTPAGRSGDFCLEVKSSNIPGVVGMKIDLDPEQGYLIRRVERPRGVKVAQGINVVQEFDIHNGISIPKLIKNTLGSMETIQKVLICEVNMPVSDSELALDFLEGGRVDEPRKGIIHIWGKDGPSKTFSNATDLAKYIEKNESERQREVNRGNTTQPWLFPLVVGNIVLVFIFGVLVIVRRKYVKSKV